MWPLIGDNLCGALTGDNLCGPLLEIICVGLYWR